MAWRLKVIGAFFIFCFFSLFGIITAFRLKAREKELSAVAETVRKIKCALLYKRSEISDILPAAFKEIGFLEFKENKVYIKHSSLNREDTEIIEDFFKTIGSSVLKDEVEKCENFENLILERKAAAKMKAVGNCRISVTAGVCMGLVSAVLIL